MLTAGCHNDSASPTTPKVPPAAQVSVSNPIQRRLEDWDEFTGRLAAPQTVEIRSRVSGYLDKVHFQEGSLVRPGDLLVTIDPRPYRAVADRLAADLSRARHRADLAAAEAQRADSLFKTRAISADDHDQRIKASAEAIESVRAAEAGLQTAQLDLEFTEIRAPIAGRISNARVTSGNLVSGGDSGATLLTTIVSIDPIYCYVDVDERSALRYRGIEKDPSRTRLPDGRIPAFMALTDESGFPRPGHIDFIDNQLNPTTGTLRIRAVFPNPDGRAAPGFFARVRLPGGSPYDGVLIRDSAIGSDQGHPFVFVAQDDNTAAYRAITTGPLIDGLRVVRNGLQSSERVVLTGLMGVRAGTVLQPTPVPMTATAGTNAATAATPHP